MFCEKCGKPNSKDASFCVHCGQPVVILSNGPITVSNQPPQTVVDFNNSVVNNEISTYNQPLNGNNNLSTKNDFKMYLIGGGFGLLLVILVILIAGQSAGTPVFIDTSEPTTENDVAIQEPIPPRGPHETVIVNNRTHSGIFVSNPLEARRLISEDSTNQKHLCPPGILEIENRIIRNFGIEAVNLCEMDIDFALQVERVTGIVWNDFPMARGFLTNLTLDNTPRNVGAIAWFHPAFPFITNVNDDFPVVMKTKIGLNTQFYLNLPRLENETRRASETGFSPPNGTGYSVVFHEYGHLISFIATLVYFNKPSVLIIDSSNVLAFNRMAQSWSASEHSRSMAYEAFQNYRNRTGTSMTFTEFRGSISRYALHRDNAGNYVYEETIAEAFTDYYMNGENAAAASREIMAVLKQRLGG